MKTQEEIKELLLIREEEYNTYMRIYKREKYEPLRESAKLLKQSIEDLQWILNK